MEQPLLSLQHITRYYQSGDSVIKALDNVSLDIWQGEYVAIMGQSGSGKTTLMNILGCLDAPSSGKYYVNNTSISSLKEDRIARLRRETFGFVFQRYNLLPLSDAQQNVELPAIYTGLAKKERYNQARELLGKLDLENRSTHLPTELSGGQQQRVAIARALMNDPPVILADEPTGALDTNNGEEVLSLLKTLHDEGRTIVLITHDPDIAAHASRVIRLQDGKIVEDSGHNPNIEHKFAKHHTQPVETIGTATGLTMEITEAIRTAFRSLHANLFRTALTLLGIVIGVAAVIILLAIGNGSKQQIIDQIEQLGTNIVTVRPDYSKVRTTGDYAILYLDDAEALEEIPNVVAVAAERDGQKTLRFGNKDYGVSIAGVGHAFPLVRDWPVEKGHFFNERDMKSYTPVIVLGKTVADTLFEKEIDPIGQYIMVGTMPFEVIGIMSEKGTAPWGTDQDNVVFVPVTTAQVRLFSGNYLNYITLKLADMEQLEKTEALIESTLLARHGQQNFVIRNASFYLETAAESQNTLTILLGAVAAISLLVGGIGVMNIMLVSVTERTREIGIRMATGARTRDIMIQFNTEAIVVCTIGGLVGVILGFIGGWIVSLFDLRIVFTVFAPLLAFSCAVLTGIFFGYLPARKASRLDPIIALSSE